MDFCDVFFFRFQDLSEGEENQNCNSEYSDLTCPAEGASAGCRKPEGRALMEHPL
jgi:hypothetical protein